MKLQPSATAITNITLAIQNTCQSALATLDMDTEYRLTDGAK